MKFLAVLLLASAMIVAVKAFPSGAQLSACDTLTPIHGEYMGQTNDSPYTIDTAQFVDEDGELSYIPGYTYTRECVSKPPLHLTV